MDDHVKHTTGNDVWSKDLESVGLISRCSISSTPPESKVRSKIWFGCLHFTIIITTSCEYTPLLEDFTDKFIESQMALTGPNQLVNLSQSKYVPQELLYICQQQVPFNPNVIPASDTSSVSSKSSLDNSLEFDQLDSSEPFEETGCVYYMTRMWNKFCEACWCFKQLLLLVTLMSFNFGMCLTPQIFIDFFSMSHNNPLKRASADHSLLFDLICLILMQILLSSLATISGMILLYSASNVIDLLRRRIKFSIKYQLNIGNNLISAYWWTMLTFERIVYETLGICCSKILALIIILYTFCMSSVYVLLLDDYVNMLFATLATFPITSTFCRFQDIFSHQVLVSVWTTLVIVLLIGLASFWLSKIEPQSIAYLFLLSMLKNIAIVIGFCSMVYITFCVVYFYYQNVTQTTFGYTQRQSTLLKMMCINVQHDSTFDWNCLQSKNWLLLFASLPLLIMSFHMNEMLVMLLYSSYNRQYYQQLFETGLTQETLRPAISSSESLRASINHRKTAATKRTSLLAQSLDTTRYSSLDSIGTYPTMPSSSLTDSPGMALSVPRRQQSIQPPLFYLTSLNAFKHYPFYASFATVRNLYILASFIICILNIVVNVYLYMSTFDIRNKSSPKSTKIYFLQLDFLHRYLYNAFTETRMQYLCLGVVVMLLLKTTITFVLVTFRGIISLYCLFEGKASRTTNRITNTNHTRSNFQFVAPFLAWTFLSLLLALWMEYHTETLQSVIWTVAFLGIVILLLYPAMLILYFSVRTLAKRSSIATTLTFVSVSFKPIRCPKFFSILGIVFLVTGLFYLVFWLFTLTHNDTTHHQSLLSFIPLIEPINSRTVLCNQTL